ncbi:hypothetical protein E5676_scaffold376G00940 [Cucumis melo var. makuwa]|uniref:Uncharacterized protein n=1 Tax=Cucumis melo var. makuwa TaxID=1194695 RepID=A0A5D3C2D4_CUCMM|nr:hypothetical protein E6C27_scaffold44G00900 [Cucumis melo var. makuwa]TYK05997.1 hypothetical protein E5676_scaffold376G00940 [Cucumis melo var. makuwa]
MLHNEAWKQCTLLGFNSLNTASTVVRSHGQSQEVKAATLLHKAMEYDTNNRRRFQKGAIDIDYNYFVTLTPSKVAIAATLLHKATEYETTHNGEHP